MSIKNSLRPYYTGASSPAWDTAKQVYGISENTSEKLEEEAFNRRIALYSAPPVVNEPTEDEQQTTVQEQDLTITVYLRRTLTSSWKKALKLYPTGRIDILTADFIDTLKYFAEELSVTTLPSASNDDTIVTGSIRFMNNKIFIANVGTSTKWYLLSAYSLTTSTPETDPENPDEGETEQEDDLFTKKVKETIRDIFPELFSAEMGKNYGKQINNLEAKLLQVLSGTYRKNLNVTTIPSNNTVEVSVSAYKVAHIIPEETPTDEVSIVLTNDFIGAEVIIFVSLESDQYTICGESPANLNNLTRFKNATWRVIKIEDNEYSIELLKFEEIN